METLSFNIRISRNNAIVYFMWLIILVAALIAFVFWLIILAGSRLPVDLRIFQFFHLQKPVFYLTGISATLFFILSIRFLDTHFYRKALLTVGKEKITFSRHSKHTELPIHNILKIEILPPGKSTSKYYRAELYTNFYIRNFTFRIRKDDLNRLKNSSLKEKVYLKGSIHTP